MPREDAATKVARYLLEGRVKVSRHDRHSAVINVQGSDKEPYTVTFAAGTWHCDCPARKVYCAHVLAAQMISPLVEEPDVEVSLTQEDPVLDAMFRRNV